MNIPSPESGMEEDFEHFFETSLCGFLTTKPDGRIIRANVRLAAWLDLLPADLVGERFSELLTIGSKIFYETHLAPLLRMQGHFDEMALELSSPKGIRQKTLLNAYEVRSPNGDPLFIRITLLKAADRQIFEQNLMESRSAALTALSTEKENSEFREQFIGVLGHDLRNPLGAIVSGTALLGKMPLGERGQAVVEMLTRSAGRMSALIDDVMDFARGRLGGGMTLSREKVNLEPVLSHVVDELQSTWPDRPILVTFDLPDPIDCDRSRLSQLLSNLLANALTHGADSGEIRVFAGSKEGGFEMWVANPGKQIPEDAIARLFTPFTREGDRPSQNGLGLGLYISSEIARAHGGSLSVQSTDAETRFTFEMPLSKGALNLI